MELSETIATAIMIAVAAYVAVGVGMAAWLQAGVLARRDPSMHGASWLFRIAVTPGLVALWPLMMAAPRDGHLRAEHQPATAPRRLRRRHALAMPVLCVALPILAAWALVARESLVEPTNAALPAQFVADAELTHVVRKSTALVDGFAIRAMVLADAQGRRHVVELDVREDIPLRAPALYWLTEFSVRQPMRGSEFLGAVPGRGVHRFELPAELANARGEFAIVSFDDNRRLVPSMSHRTAPRIGG